MAAIAHLVVSWLAAVVVVARLFPALPAPVRLAGAFGVSIALTAWVTFGAALLAHAIGLPDATLAGVLVALAVNAAIVVAGRRELRPDTFRMSGRVLAGVLAALAASGAIVAQRLGGDPLKVSLNTWGDTALHIGIARSFSRGDNYPPQLPIFSGDGIRYHFGVDFYAGTLEKLGLPIDWALNVPATLGFTAIMILVAALAWHLWRSAWVGVIAAVLFLTNGSLAFLRYFAQYPTLGAALDPANWSRLDKYLAIAPYQNGEVISIFWTLNPYLTQTHLIVGMAIVLFVVYVLVSHLRGPAALAGSDAAEFADEDRRVPIGRGQAVALGVLLGGSFWINGILVIAVAVPCCVLVFLYSGQLRRRALPAAALTAAAVGLFATGSALDSDGLRVVAITGLLGGLVLLGSRQWWPFFGALGASALPQMIWLNGGLSTASSLVFHWGYLVNDFRLDNPKSYLDLLGYWWLNLGLVGPLVLVAAVVARRADRKLLVAIMSIFVFGNVVSFGEDIGGHGHKVFNLWETLVNLFAADALVWIARRLWRAATPGRVVAAVAVPAMALVLVLSGLLDLMTLRNDPRYEVFGDNQAAIAWIEDHTSPSAVFLTAYGDPYTVPTLAGRRVYLGGFTGWAGGFGYDTAARETTIRAVYTAADRTAACDALRGSGVDYIQVGSGETADSRFPGRHPDLFPGLFTPAWTGSGFAYYDVAASCGSAAPRTGGTP